MILRILSWSLPPVILWIVLRRIDFDRLLALLANADGRLIVSGMAISALIVGAGAARWHWLMNRYGLGDQPYRRTLADYWKSLAIGVVAPGSLGSDAFRVVLLGRPLGQYLRAMFIIVLEKLGALAACLILLAGLFPLVAPNGLPGWPVAPQTVLLIGVLGIASIVVVARLIRRQPWGALAARWLTVRMDGLAQRVARWAGTEAARQIPRPGTGTLIASAFSLPVAVPTTLLSLLVFALSATQAQLFFVALGTPVPYQVNLFIAPLLFLAFTLPITVGGVGVREAAFVLFYGAFGVSAEAALAVSTCGLASLLLSHGLGALLFLLSRRRTLDALGVQRTPSEAVVTVLSQTRGQGSP